MLPRCRRDVEGDAGSVIKLGVVVHTSAKVAAVLPDVRAPGDGRVLPAELVSGQPA